MKDVILTIIVSVITTLVSLGYLSQWQADTIKNVAEDLLSGGVAQEVVVYDTTGDALSGVVQTGVFMEEAE